MVCLWCSIGSVAKTVITYGTYDLLHKGHVLLLERAKRLGDYLIVGLSTDAFNAVKSKSCVYPYEDRFQIVSAIKYVDEVIPEECWEQKAEDIKKLGVDVLVMGDDWEGRFDSLREYCEVVYLPRTLGISTTSIKTGLGGKG
jgi:glycerol-3-phosphate cytidylyltransferase